MNALVGEPLSDVNAPEETWAVSDEAVRAQVRAQVSGLLTTFCPRSGMKERRGEQRYPFPYLIHLTPVGDDGVSPEGETIVVVGRHLSERGLGFYHPQPLPYRRMIVSLEVSPGIWLGFLIALSWCRFTKEGWYESGGRFLQAVPSPVNAAQS
jgi:hypothetical protein